MVPDAMADGATEQPLLLDVAHVIKRVRGARGELTILDDVTLRVEQDRSVGIVGESGCGKSTLAEIVVGLQRPSDGMITFRGVRLGEAAGSKARELRSRMRIVFQDPFSSLNPRHKVLDIVSEPLRHHTSLSKSDRRRRAAELLEAVGLSPRRQGGVRPAQLSGGQAQRVAIARALATDPDLLILDEAVSSLDVSVRAQILNLLHRLRKELGLTYVFIAHDLDAVRYVSEMVVVMYLGRICEVLPTENIGNVRMHPYTELLFGADHSAVWSRGGIAEDAQADEPPSIFDRPSGCPYRTRCPEATSRCAGETPELHVSSNGGLVACHARAS